MTDASRLLAFHNRFWVSQRPDTVERIDVRETELGIRFPATLRAIYANTSLRHATQLHLMPLDGVDMRGINTDTTELLWIAHDQQSSGAYGIRLSDLHLPDPTIYSDEAGDPRPEPCTLSQLLEYFWVVNRPFAAPWAAFDDPIDLSDWLAFTNPLAEDEVYWLKDGFVHERYDYRVGARSKPEMERLFAEVGDAEFDEVIWDDPEW
jgi:hypothetical protein